jgi:hypothetical protein
VRYLPCGPSINWFSKKEKKKQSIHPFIYLQPGGYSPLEKLIKCLERGRTNNLEVMPSSAIEKVQNAKREYVLPFPVLQIQKAALSSTMPLSQYCCPLAATGASREVSFVVRI